jgi:hypothetical protein
MSEKKNSASGSQKEKERKANNSESKHIKKTHRKD